MNFGTTARQQSYESYSISQNLNYDNNWDKLTTQNDSIISSTHTKENNFKFHNIIPTNIKNISTDALEKVSTEYVKKYRILPLYFGHEELILLTDNANNWLQEDDIIRDLNLGPNISIILQGIKEEEFPVFSDLIMKFYGINLKNSAEFMNEVNEVVKSTNIFTSYQENEEEDDDDTEIAADSTEITQLVSQIIESGVNKEVSDIHIEPKTNGARVRFRILGELVTQYDLPITKKQLSAVINRIKILSNLEITERTKSQDGIYRYKIGNRTVECRIAVTPTIFKEKVVIRIQDTQNENTRYNLEKIGFNDITINRLKKLINETANGMFIVTGPVGSGKTTTLHAILDCFDADKNNIVTCEDPVEIVNPKFSQTQISSTGNMTYQSYLKSSLRSDPDIIYFGEIRDSEVAKVALEGSQIGKKLFTTLHTNSAIESIQRLTGFNIEGISRTDLLMQMRFFLSQRLVKVLCPHCKEKEFDFSSNKLSKNEVEELRKYGAYKKHEGGCSYCNNSGIIKRTVLWELLEFTAPIKDFLREEHTSHEIYNYIKERGFISMWEIGFEKVKKGEIALNELIQVADKFI